MKRTSPIWFPCLVLASLTMLDAGCEHKHPEPVKGEAPTVDIAMPVQTKVEDYQIFTARTQAVQSVEVRPRVTGYLTKICFKDGAMVKEGDVLFEIDDRIYKDQFDEAKGNLQRLRGKLQLDQTQVDRYTRLVEQSAASQQDLDVYKGQLAETKGGIAQAVATVEKANQYYTWCKVTAPISGRANRHFVDLGNLINQDTTTLTNIVSEKPIWVYFDVDENTADIYQLKVKKGTAEPIRRAPIPIGMALGNSDDYNAFHGEVDFVSNQFDANTGSIRLRATFPNDGYTLFAGMFCRVKLPVSKLHEALLVNDKAIGSAQTERFILVLNDKNEVERRVVQVGQEHDKGLREVMPQRTIWKPDRDGKEVETTVTVLTPTDRVVVDGLQHVKPGIKVTPRDVDMATLMPTTAPDKVEKKP